LCYPQRLEAQHRVHAALLDAAENLLNTWEPRIVFKPESPRNVALVVPTKATRTPRARHAHATPPLRTSCARPCSCPGVSSPACALKAPALRDSTGRGATEPPARCGCCRLERAPEQACSSRSGLGTGGGDTREVQATKEGWATGNESARCERGGRCGAPDGTKASVSVASCTAASRRRPGRNLDIIDSRLRAAAPSACLCGQAPPRTRRLQSEISLLQSPA